MTPERWSAMQTAANTADGHDWIVAVGYGGLVLFLVGWCVLAAIWWRNEMQRRAKERTFEGRTWR